MKRAVPDYVPEEVMIEMIHQVFDDYLNAVKFDPHDPPSIIPTLDTSRLRNSFLQTVGDKEALQGVFKDVYVQISNVMAHVGISKLVDKEGSLDYRFDRLIGSGDRMVLIHAPLT